MTEFKSLLGTVFVDVKFKDKPLPHKIDNFKYIYNEEGLDSCIIVFRGLQEDGPDLPEFQEEAALSVTWGYLAGDTKTRKVYVGDVKWDFSKDLRQVTIEATEKAVTVKQTKSNKIHKDKSLPEVVDEVGKRHGLRAMVDLGTKEGKMEIGMALSKYKLRQETLKKYNYDELSPRFRVRKNVPQANKSDAQMLEEWGMKELNSQWFTETRDDEIVLKRRNFNQKPYRAYTYSGGTGELFSFAPEHKTKNKLGSALNSMVSFWDKQKKQFIQQQANMVNSQMRTFLIEYLKTTGFVPKNLKIYGGNKDRAIEVTVDAILSKDTYGKYNQVVKDADPIVGKQLLTKTTFGQRGINGAAVDNLAVIQRGERAVSVYEIEDAATKAQQAVTDVTHDAQATNAGEAAPSAQNPRDNASLQMNPATALVWGDPNLETGQILTMNKVGKKFGGNYYSIKCVHDVSQNSGYNCSIELTRQGHNLKASSNAKAIKTANKQINQEIGLDKRTQKQILLKEATNKKSPKR